MLPHLLDAPPFSLRLFLPTVPPGAHLIRERTLTMRLSRTFILPAITIALLVASSGCQNKLHDDNLALHQQNRELQTQLSEKEDRLRAAPDPAQLAAMQKEI